MASATQKKDGIGESIKTIVFALLIAGAFRTLFFQPFWIPSGSMKETLLIGDFLFVNKMAYGYSKYSCPFAICPISGRIFASEPERGDIVVFRHPTAGTDYIKRLIGLPGDRVQTRDGRLYLNDTMVPQEPAGDFSEPYAQQGPVQQFPRCENAPVGEGGTCLKSRTIETLPNDVSYPVLNIDNNGAADNTPVFTVPEGHFFFMGDNRDNSLDSRAPQAVGGVGMVPFDHLIGRARHVVFSSAGSSMLYFWTWRSDRFFVGLE
ncbi:signal peptidase I [Roseicitreum antarcticum]|uniref:Signal peptidase I n=1 Tax=Roseicitreum antarcticum TaxID=564137 RepID=A0A1H3AQB5_9RHOB|nr:signal peptidase I [Roseicitreum antarcticum]SDX31588.1 signal peptidase I . Serine peptidase. MEROPS family S26A [Roseicitreum antarcticum]